MRFAACALAVVLFAACGDAGPSPGQVDATADATDDVAPPDTSDDAGGDTVSPGPDAAGHDAAGDTAGDVDADAGPDAAGSCVAPGGPCDPFDLEPGAGFFCARRADGAGECRPACAPSTPQACPQGQACLVPAHRTTGFCAPAACDGFEADTCGAGAQCLPAPDGGACVAGGSGAPGVACAAHAACQLGSVCHQGRCAVAGCAADQPSTCPLGATCVPAEGPADAPLELTVCDPSCVAFAPDDPCPAGTWCAPTPGQPDGTCVAPAPDAGALGEACADAGCCGARAAPGCASAPAVEACVCAQDAYCCEVDWDATCGQLAEACELGCGPAPAEACAQGLTCVAGTCRAACAFDGGPQWTCGVAEACLPVYADGAPSAWGACVAGCEPFTSDPTCGVTHWCRPLFFGGGACQPIANTNTGEGTACGAVDPALPCCDATSDCADSAVKACACAADASCCSGWDQDCVAAAVDLCGAHCSPPPATCDVGMVCLGGRCQPACLPGAAPETAGACQDDGDLCRTLEAGGADLAFGVCRQICAFPSGACDLPGQFCAAADVLGQPQDLCVFAPDAIADFPLAAGAPCPAGAPAGTFCAPNRLCVSGTCTDLCLAVTAPLDTAPHPDCSDPRASCVPLSDAVGLCD